MGRKSKPLNDDSTKAAASLYLHFLDRELLQTYGVYKDLSPQRVDDDIRLCILATTEPCLVSMSVLFESDFAFGFFERHRRLLARHDIIQLVGNSDSLVAFISAKRDVYDYDRAKYSRYFSDAWKEIEDEAPTLLPKLSDTTTVLRRRVTERIEGLQTAGSAEFDILKRRSIDRLASSQRPVTADLLEPALEVTTATTKRLFNLQISLSYVETYLSDYGAAIPNGLKSGLKFFETIGSASPLFNLRDWRDVYAAIGLYPFLLELNADEIIGVRDSGLHSVFIEAVRRHLRQSEARLSTMVQKSLLSPIADLLSKLREVKRRPLDPNFLDATLEAAIAKIREFDDDEEANGKASLKRDWNVTLHTKAKTLDFSDGRRVELSPEEFRVLFALATTASQVARLGVRGMLTDSDIATAYFKDVQQDAGKATATAYEFCRALRRRLKGAGVSDRNAVIRRSRNRGIMLGSRWGKPAVRGNSEPRIYVGRKGDIGPHVLDASTNS